VQALGDVQETLVRTLGLDRIVQLVPSHTSVNVPSSLGFCRLARPPRVERPAPVRTLPL
jgi:hypothetical protein